VSPKVTQNISAELVCINDHPAKFCTISGWPQKTIARVCKVCKIAPILPQLFLIWCVVTTGPWTVEEDQKLKRLFHENDGDVVKTTKWSLIATKMDNRNSKQCR
jgi:hypothetical protein